MAFNINIESERIPIGTAEKLYDLKYVNQIKSVVITDEKIQNFFKCKITLFNEQSAFGAFHEEALREFIKGIDPERVFNHSSIDTCSSYTGDPINIKDAEILLERIFQKK